MATMKRLGVGIGVALLASLVVCVRPALAQSTQQRVADMNREAMEAYNNLDINRAGSLLEEALRVAAQGSVSGDLLARTHLNLGVVYVGGLGDNANGLDYFTRALCLDASVRPDPLIGTPDIQSVFQLAEQRASSGECPGGAAPAASGGPAPAAAPGGIIQHQPPAKQQTQTPLPIYVELASGADVEAVHLYYLGLGMADFKQVEMAQVGAGYGYQIPCADVWEPQVRYYIEAKGPDGATLGSAGNAVEPITVSIVSRLSGPGPAFPGASPPQSCASSECPPGIDCGAQQSGSGGLGDTCGTHADCQSGMACIDNFCSLGERGSRSDRHDAASDDIPRFFARVGLTTGFTWVREGMTADRKPPAHLIYDPPITNGTIQPNSELRRGTPWVADADSYGQSGAPISNDCAADGIESHPDSPTADRNVPSKYCVRVPNAGFVPNLALRSEIGYWVLPRLALEAIFRFQFASGEGTLANMLLGGRVELMITKPKAEGFMLSALAGGTLGQIQARPSIDGATGDEPYVISGLGGAHVGMSARYRLMRNFGLHLTPELDLQFPDFLMNIDATLGVEAAF